MFKDSCVAFEGGDIPVSFCNLRRYLCKTYVKLDTQVPHRDYRTSFNLEVIKSVKEKIHLTSTGRLK